VAPFEILDLKFVGSSDGFSSNDATPPRPARRGRRGKELSHEFRKDTNVRLRPELLFVSLLMAKMTLRDLFAIVTIAAILVAWWVDHRRMVEELERQSELLRWAGVEESNAYPVGDLVIPANGKHP
jgi:hypothetical protein